MPTDTAVQDADPLPPRPWTFVGNSWQHTTIYDANGHTVLRLDLEDWGVTEDNQDELEKRQAALAQLIIALPDLLTALKTAIKVADEARDEWDAAPSGMRAGKLLIALSGRLQGYRTDIDAIHAAIAKAQP